LRRNISSSIRSTIALRASVGAEQFPHNSDTSGGSPVSLQIRLKLLDENSSHVLHRIISLTHSYG